MSGTKIEKLTPEQEAYLPVFREEYRQVGLSTERANFQEAKQAVEKLYELNNLKKPETFLFFSSPILCELFLNLLGGAQLGEQLREQLEMQLGEQLWSQLVEQLGEQLREQLREQLVEQLREQLREQLETQLWSQLREQLEMQLREQLWTQLWSQLGEQLWSQLGEQLREQLEMQLGEQLEMQLWSQLREQLREQLETQLRKQLVEQLREQLRKQLGEQLREQLEMQLGEQRLTYFGTWAWGALDSYWIAFYRFCTCIGVKYPENEKLMLGCYDDIANSAYWWYPFNDICLISDRPEYYRLDERGRLHCTEGPAIRFTDGWSTYAVHGVRVPEWIIMEQDKITIDRITDESNAEIRRIMMELYGWDRFVHDSSANLIHQDRYGKLFKCNWMDGTVYSFVEVTNSTPEPDGTFKQYCLPVPPNMETAHQAVAWTFYETPETYHPLTET